MTLNMTMANSSNNKRKRSSPDASSSSSSSSSTQTHHQLCAHCQERSAAVLVDKKPLCLLHYYTSDYVRLIPPDKVVQSCFPEATAEQLPGMQNLFATVFVELQKQISEDSARSFRSSNNDPLAILHSLHTHKTTTRKGKATKAPSPKPNNNKKPPPSAKAGGGFMQPLPLPERLLRTQQEQARKQVELTQRMNRAASSAVEGGHSHIPSAAASRVPQQQTPTTRSATERRRPSRKSIWNAILDEKSSSQAHHPPHRLKQQPSGSSTPSAPPEARIQATEETATMAFTTFCCSSCQSTRVEALGTNSSRNDSQRKGETWGNKDRGQEVWTRYQCLQCGKIWNEEE